MVGFILLVLFSGIPASALIGKSPKTAGQPAGRPALAARTDSFSCLGRLAGPDGSFFFSRAGRPGRTDLFLFWASQPARTDFLSWARPAGRPGRIIFIRQ